MSTELEQEVSTTAVVNNMMDSSLEDGSEEPSQTGVGVAGALTGEEGEGELIQLEPTEEELERERLVAMAEQLQEEIQNLHLTLREKEEELAKVKSELGITPLVELKQSVVHGWKVMGDKWKEVQETETFRKIDDTLTGWKQRVEGSETYQKTKTTLGEGGKKASGAISSAGTKIKESETVKVIGEKTSSALKRTGTAIKDTGTAIKESERVKNMGASISSFKEKVMSSFDYGDSSAAPQQEGDVPKETVVPDESPKE